MSSIVDVARALRSHITDVDPNHLIVSLAAGQITDASPMTIRLFITQAIEHQPVTKDSADSRVFPAKILSVKRITRESNGSLLGRKAQITMETSAKGGGTQEEVIDTGWVEFKGESDPDKIGDERLVWEVALSRSIEEDAEALVGRTAFVRKSVVAASGGSQKRVRSIVDIAPKFGEDNGPSRSSSPKRGSRSGGDSFDVSAVRDLCEDLGIKFHRDFEVLADVKVWSGDDEGIAGDVAKAAAISKKDTDEFIEMYLDSGGKTPQEKALLALADW